MTLSNANHRQALREKKEFEKTTLNCFVVRQNDFDKIKVQLRALGLIAKSEKHRSVKDTRTYWTLTPYG